ncbi:MAG: hypothetical protein HQK51_12805 [Oligoflexia bacterium]|nr:hypothetical protein [Oligoflexia bacterium]
MASARLPFALIGSLLLFVPLLFRNYFHRHCVLLLTFFLGLSPTLIYWSRYIQHDFLILLLLLLISYGMFASSSHYRFFLIFSSLVLAMLTNQNFSIVAILVSFYVFLEYLLLTFLVKKFPPITSLIGHFCLSIKKSLYIFLFSGLLALGLYLGISNFISIPPLTVPESFEHPFSYYLLLLGWYEPLLLLSAIFYLFHFYIKNHNVYRIIGGTLLFTSLGISSLLPLLILHPLILVVYHLAHNERKMAFWGFIFFASLLFYSLISNKNAAAIIYILIPGMIYFVLYFEKFLPALLSFKVVNVVKIAVVVLLLFQLRLVIMVNFNYSNEGQVELIAGKETTPRFNQLMLLIKQEIETVFLGENKKFLVYDQNIYWPFFWYFRDVRESTYTYSSTYSSNKIKSTRGFYYVLINQDRKEELIANHATETREPIQVIMEDQYGNRFLKPKNTLKKKVSVLQKNMPEIPVSDPENTPRTVQTALYNLIDVYRWWYPDYQNLTIEGYLLYLFSRKGWNPPGYYKVYFARRKDV